MSGTGSELLVHISETTGDLDGFALLSEPSHTLLAFVLNSDKDARSIRRGAWYLSDVAPFLATGNPPGQRPPMEMSTPIRRDASFGFGSLGRCLDDNLIVFSAAGEGLRAWRGNQVERIPLAQGGMALRPGSSWAQSFALLPPSHGLDSYILCGCGQPPPPCGEGSGQCSGCIDCVLKPGSTCLCCRETTEECDWCGRSYPICGGQCPFC